MYDAGELSMMIVSPIGLPSWDKSYGCQNNIEGEKKGRQEKLGPDSVCQMAKKTYFYIVTLMIMTTFSKQAMFDDAMDVEHIQDRVCILGQRGGEDHYLIDFPHLPHKLIHTRSLDHVNIVNCVFNLHGDDEV